MGRVPEPKEVSVRVPKISGRTDGEPYPNRKLSGTQFRVPNNFGSGFWLPNYPIFVHLAFLANNCIVFYPSFFGPLLLIIIVTFLKGQLLVYALNHKHA